MPKKPERGYSLSAAQRARLRPGIDVEALRRLLAAVPDDVRPTLLAAFDAKPDWQPWGWSAAGSKARSGRALLPPEVQDLTFADPKLHALLNQVVAPLTGAASTTGQAIREDVQRLLSARGEPLQLVLPVEWHGRHGAAVVVPRRNPNQSDMILLDAAADAAVLDRALEALVTERTRIEGPGNRSDLEIAPPETPRALPALWREHLSGTLARLAAQPEAAVEHVGRARVMSFCITA